MTTQTSDFKIEKKDSGKRIDIFLSENSEYSRSHIQKLIKEGAVLMNGRACNKDHALKEKDKISVSLKEPEKISLEPDKNVKFDVVFENEDLAVINKPAGLVVHPSATHKKGTLVNGMLARWPKIKDVGEDKLRPGIVHRLDKDTSGLMLVAKNNETFSWLKEQFKDRKVSKKYLALVFGNMKKRYGVIEEKIGRLGTKQVTPKKGKASVKNAREALTEYKVKKEYKGFALVEAMPKTGRMHQIRVHLAHIGHPLVGDKKYASKKMLKAKAFKRQFLHAEELVFSLKNGQKMAFSASLPEDLENMLNTLEKY